MMKTTELNVTIVKGKEGQRAIAFENAMECRVNPNTFEGEWLKHYPTTKNQKMHLDLYLNAKKKGTLHPFTCMRIDPSIEDGKLVYQRGLQPATKLSLSKWKELIKNYAPSRNSRQMTLTEYACRNLFLIQQLVEAGYERKDAWAGICDKSVSFGHYCDSTKHVRQFEPTGSRGVCDFYDLGNTLKFLTPDEPCEKGDSIWVASGCYLDFGKYSPIGYMRQENFLGIFSAYGVYEMVMD